MHLNNQLQSFAIAALSRRLTPDKNYAIADNTILQIAAMATQALYAELFTYPKPGLVSLCDSGSHTDMDYVTFMHSINALQPYFREITLAGSRQEGFCRLNILGRNAEAQMLKATGGINTHRGAIFILGMLSAAVAATLVVGGRFADISKQLVKLWGKDLLLHKTIKSSNGHLVRSRYLLRHILAEAADGFPLIFSLVDEYMYLTARYAINPARSIVFLRIMQVLDDTNLVHRGGIEALEYAKYKAGVILDNYSACPENLNQQLFILHKEFIASNLSPGGCADVLAAVIFLAEIKTSLFNSHG